MCRSLNIQSLIEVILKIVERCATRIENREEIDISIMCFSLNVVRLIEVILKIVERCAARIENREEIDISIMCCSLNIQSPICGDLCIRPINPIFQRFSECANLVA